MDDLRRNRIPVDSISAMESNDTTERALAERVHLRTQQLAEAQAALDQYRVDREAERQIELDRELALTLQEAEDEQPIREAEAEQRRRTDQRRNERVFGRHFEEDDPHQRRVRNRGWGGPEWGEPVVPVESDFEEEEDLNQGSCVTCLDDLSDQDAHRSPCGHDWCRACIVNRFEMAARNTHLFPAQCCGEPILPDNHELIAPETWSQYFEKRAEVETRNPTYCSKRDCSKFIPLRDITEGQANCVCGRVTCASCKAEWHSGECVTDPETEEVLRLAREQQWQTCFHCREMVVRRDGCNEMGTYSANPYLNVALEASANHQSTECRCGHTFCYACGLEWKTCSCPQFGPRPNITAQRLREPTLTGRPRNVFDPARDGWNPGPVLADDWGVEPVEPVEADNTRAPVQEAAPRAPGRWVPRHLRPHEPVQPVEVGNTGAPVEETAVDGPTEGRPRPASPNNPACGAHNWQRIRGGATCQSCNTVMANFLFRCRTCHHTSCARCRRRADRAR